MMRYNIPLIFLVSIFASSLVALAGESRDILRVTITQTVPLAKGSLHLHWSIKNQSPKSVVVYTTFLRGPSAGHRRLASGEVEVFTSLMAHSDVDVNNYPKADLVDLRPGEQIEGDLVDSVLVDRWAMPNERLSLDAAYGYDKDALQRALAGQASNPRGGHPANPIVEWQKIAKSNRILLH